jgi:F-type H+-transporting ATPase subunit b
MNPAILQHFGDSSSGIGTLGFSGQAFLIQLITFILAYFVLRRYAFGPILKALRQRRETIESSVKLAEQLQKDKLELEEQVEKTLHETRQQADTIIADAQDAARQVVQEAEEKAKQKVSGILTSAEEKIQQETSRARQSLEKELMGLVAEATEAVVQEKVDVKKDGQLIERALKEQRV